MKDNTNEKSLSRVNDNSIFYKIRKFFKDIFNSKSINNNVQTNKISTVLENNKKKKFIEEIKNIENEETTFLKLQNKYRLGKIKEEELSENQIDLLCKLYDKQIASLKKSNTLKKQKLLEYKKRNII